MTTRDVVDAVIEAPIVPSFTRIGFGIRRRLEHWTPLESYDLSGRVMVLTGATSGLGRAAATQFARCEATLVLVGRNPDRNDTVVAEEVDRLPGLLFVPFEGAKVGQNRLRIDLRPDDQNAEADRLILRPFGSAGVELDRSPAVDQSDSPGRSLPCSNHEVSSASST